MGSNRRAGQGTERGSGGRRVGRYGGVKAALAALCVLVAGCAVELQNVKPAREMARRALPADDVYIGWRVYQQKCAACHGPTGTGSASAPDLLATLREMGSRQFVGVVLRRYDALLGAAESGPAGAPRDALVEKILQGREDALTMPAWQGDPTVSAHIIDLYAYLSGRADGTVGPGRPAP